MKPIMVIHILYCNSVVSKSTVFTLIRPLIPTAVHLSSSLPSPPLTILFSQTALSTRSQFSFSSRSVSSKADPHLLHDTSLGTLALHGTVTVHRQYRTGFHKLCVGSHFLMCVCVCACVYVCTVYVYVCVSVCACVCAHRSDSHHFWWKHIRNTAGAYAECNTGISADTSISLERAHW